MSGLHSVLFRSIHRIYGRVRIRFGHVEVGAASRRLHCFARRIPFDKVWNGCTRNNSRRIDSSTMLVSATFCECQLRGHLTSRPIFRAESARSV
jgi:hypothetical protein